MNHTQPKFILTKDGTLRFGLVRRHTELLMPDETCIGGGFYEVDIISHRLLLKGASSEYGEPAWEKTDRLKVHPHYLGLDIVYTSWDSWKKEIPISEIFEIVYE